MDGRSSTRIGPVRDDAPAADARSVATVESAFRHHHETIYCYLRRRTRCAQDAEELAQDVFADAVAAVRGGRPPRCMEAWLFTIAHRRLVDHLRRSSGERPRACEGESVDIDVDVLVLARAIVRSIARLSVLDRHLVGMRLLQGGTTAEVATALGLTETACRMRLARARRELAASAAGEHPPRPGSYGKPTRGGPITARRG